MATHKIRRRFVIALLTSCCLQLVIFGYALLFIGPLSGPFDLRLVKESPNLALDSRRGIATTRYFLRSAVIVDGDDLQEHWEELVFFQGHERWFPTGNISSGCRQLLQSLSFAHDDKRSVAPNELVNAELLEIGWPFRIAQITWINGAAAFVTDGFRYHTSGWLYHHIHTPRRGSIYVPRKWNVVAVASDLFAVSAATMIGMYMCGWARAFTRSLRGRCRKCGYPMKGPVCSECGGWHALYEDPC